MIINSIFTSKKQQVTIWIWV